MVTQSIAYIYIDLKNDSTYSKFGFPKNLDNFITKPYDLAQSNISINNSINFELIFNI